MANDIKIGNVGIGGVYIGSSSASSVYLGSNLVWTATPPTFQGKWLATYTGGTTSSADCDSSSAITKNEISKADLIEVEIGDCVTSIGNNAFSGYSSLTSVTIGSGVTSIGEWAFYQCSGLTSLTIPDSVTSIGNGALSRCSGLTSVTIGSGVTRINQSSFQFCSSLTSITIEAATPPTLSDTSVFFNTNNCPIYVPAESVSAYKAATNWSAYASRIQAIPSPTPKWLATYTGGTTSSAECDSSSAITSGEVTTTDLIEVEIGDCVTSIGDSAFSGCSSLTSVTIGSGVTSIGELAFRGCSGLTSIDIPSAVTIISQYAFSDCSSLTSVDIPSGVTSIARQTFYECSGLISCTIGSGVTSIDQFAFSYCSGLTSIDIPSAVTSIGTYVFGGCRSLTSVTVNATTPPTLANANAFANTNDCPIYVPCESVNAYKTASNWSTLASRIEGIPPCHELEYGD